MKNTLPLILLSFMSAKAAAFQAKMPPIAPTSASATSKLASPFVGFHALDRQNIKPGDVCAAFSVNGCQCPFCTQLRNAGR